MTIWARARRAMTLKKTIEIQSTVFLMAFPKVLKKDSPGPCLLFKIGASSFIAKMIIPPPLCGTGYD
jgi:hypothetical protein